MYLSDGVTLDAPVKADRRRDSLRKYEKAIQGVSARGVCPAPSRQALPLLRRLPHLPGGRDLRCELTRRPAEGGIMIEVTINWQRVDENDGSGLWHVSRGLYAYVNPDAGDEEEVLDIGKVDGTSVRRRWCRSGKEKF